MFLGYSEESSLTIGKYPKKFLWPLLLEFFKGKTKENIQDLI